MTLEEVRQQMVDLGDEMLGSCDGTIRGYAYRLLALTREVERMVSFARQCPNFAPHDQHTAHGIVDDHGQPLGDIHCPGVAT